MDLTSIELYSLHIFIDTITLNVFTILQIYWVARACPQEARKTSFGREKNSEKKENLVPVRL